MSTTEHAPDHTPSAAAPTVAPYRLPEVPAKSKNSEVNEWVRKTAELVKPDRVVWCTGSDEEIAELTDEMVAKGTLVKLNGELRPNSYLARSHPKDVARVEERTFICCENPEDAGPTNNWMNPTVMRELMHERFDGVMRGRTMYVMPFSMGPLGGAISKLGIQITDSPYAVINMAKMTRMGEDALELIEEGTEWVPALHSVGYALIRRDGKVVEDVAWPHNNLKYICHFPETREIISYGSGYGGNALLGKKCYALRIASTMAREQGWLAEHMLLVRVTAPDGTVRNIAGAFPSATGKTNFAMMRPRIPGWKVETIGDDIAWMRQREDGRLYAINPEFGFFGVAPGTSDETNPVAMETITHDTIFTNVALTPEGDIWWEGMTEKAPEKLTDWQGKPWTPGSQTPAAHPNGRFTVKAENCPSLAESWDSPDGVPIDAILFGGRRATNVPLVYETRDWSEGVFVGATLASEQTAAAEGPVGQLRRDPFAMQPFCGYNMADYWAHWLEIGERLGDKAPRIYQVNWFRKDADGRFIWPGFGDNARVIEWIFGRLDGSLDAVESPVGLLPRIEDLDLEGLDLTREQLEELFAVDPESWLYESDLTEEHFAKFGKHVPQVLEDRLARLRDALKELLPDASSSR